MFQKRLNHNYPKYSSKKNYFYLKDVSKKNKKNKNIEKIHNHLVIITET